MKFPQSFIEEIKGRISVSELVGKYASLKKAGREYQALCPFHKENTPSFTVNDEKGFYHCFGCGAHGDQIGFLMEHERLSYPEAVERAAGMAGLEVPKMSKEMVEKEEKRKSLIDVVQACADWMAEHLHTSAEGGVARDYLASRGFRDQAIRGFQLGYAPADRHALVAAMAKQRITEAQLIDAGMLIVLENQKPYSRFRRRLMFPITDEKNRVIAFGGRVLPGEPSDKVAKYVNSPETELFHKGSRLFNLANARKAAFDKEQLLVVEGYADVIALVQAGLDHAVAPLGTAITDQQLMQCWKVTNAPILCLDGDNAGLRAMQRAVDVALPMLQPGKSLSVVTLPKGEDPDSIVRQAGLQGFERLLNQAKPLVEVIWNEAVQGENATPEARAAMEQRLLKRIDVIADAKVRHYYRDEMLKRLKDWQYANRHSQQGFGGGRAGANRSGVNKGGFHKNAKSTLPPAPVVSGEASASELHGVITKLLALALWHPPLLQDGEAENLWLDLPLELGWHTQIHQAILTMLEADDAPDTVPARLMALQQRVDAAHVANMKELLNSAYFPNVSDAHSRGMIARKLWAELTNMLQHAQLKADIKAAEMALATDMSESHFERLSMLKRQLEQLERQRSIYYQDDPV